MAWTGKDSEVRALSARLARVLDSDLLHSFLKSKLVVLAAIVTLILVLLSLLAPWIAPHNPFELKSLNLLDSHTPPVWEKGGDPRFLLGTDDQGRDILSSILYGSRSSIAIGVFAVLLAMALGVSLGLIAGYHGGRIDTVIMRIADVQLTFPAILTALLIDGVARTHKGANLALAILTEATLSFLGVGLPPTEPSLGTLIRIGNNFLMSGEYWMVIFPGIALAALVLAVNLLGDWLRDALNPKLR
jgi:ABC-type dipeptide/oligopeptide/nickel transport system permease subunit